MFGITLNNSSLTKAKRVERALRGSGKQGISNGELNKISFRYSAIIFKLRNEGCTIDTVKIGNTGLFKFYFRDKE